MDVISVMQDYKPAYFEDNKHLIQTCISSVHHRVFYQIYATHLNVFEHKNNINCNYMYTLPVLSNDRQSICVNMSVCVAVVYIIQVTYMHVLKQFPDVFYLCYNEWWAKGDTGAENIWK